MSNNNNYFKQIEKLSDQLEQLQIDFAAKSNQTNNSIKKLQREIIEKQENNLFKLRNHVEITNNYKGFFLYTRTSVYLRNELA